jgi:hypothetical protein
VPEPRSFEELLSDPEIRAEAVASPFIGIRVSGREAKWKSMKIEGQPKRATRSGTQVPREATSGRFVDRSNKRGKSKSKLSRRKA